MSAPLRLAVLGDPLAHTRSPDLHRAALAALGIECVSRAIRTRADELEGRLRELAAEGLVGVNLTHPLKERALDHVGNVSEAARLARSINTVSFASAAWRGDTTDGAGFVDWMRHLGRVPGRERIVILGGGGAARSIALALVPFGGPGVLVAVREASLEASREKWRDIPLARLASRDGDLVRTEMEREATIVVNATPLVGTPEPWPIQELRGSILALDLVYGPEPTPWVRAARARGNPAQDGLGLLIFQARRSMQIWTGREVALEPLMSAVGWPR